MTALDHRDAIEAELGDLLFSCVNLARHLGIDADSALRRANLKFEDRFRRMEQMDGKHAGGLAARSAKELDVLWERTKAEGG